ncbi:MAG: hypothetical protein E7453_06005 [Ruminococcaceae bacterium]|nr:hypothetical protein [Oscillospiraceae bacterium]
MEKIVFDSGVKEYQINDNGVLRFNPSDPNVYARFFDAAEQIQQIEKDLVAKGESLNNAENSGEAAIRLMQEADTKVKEILSDVFGEGNDFDELLGGVNLLAVAGNDERVITNLMQALLPIIEEGAQKCADQRVGDAVQLAQKNRAQRRAQK